MKKHFFFPSTDRRTKIHAIQWINENVEPKGVIQLIHGMVEHIERYDEFARFLADQGFIVVGHDHLGHGRSVVSEEDYGFFDENQPALVLLQDIHRLRIGTSRQYPELPYIMLGHSMGSYLLRRYLSSHGEGLDGAIIVGTGQEADAATTAGLAFLKFEAKKHGWRYRSETAAKMTFGAPYRKFDLTGQDPERSWLSKNVESVKAYYSDPKCGFLFTLNGYWALLSTVKFDNQKKNILAIPKDLPILIVSGEDDPVGNLGKGVKKVYNAYVKAGIRDVSCRLFEGDRHEILNELDREEVYQYILDWVEMHLGCRYVEDPVDPAVMGDGASDAAEVAEETESTYDVESAAEPKETVTSTEEAADQQEQAEKAEEEPAEKKKKAAKPRGRNRKKAAKNAQKAEDSAEGSSATEAGEE